MQSLPQLIASGRQPMPRTLEHQLFFNPVKHCRGPLGGQCQNTGLLISGSRRPLQDPSSAELTLFPLCDR